MARKDDDDKPKDEQSGSSDENFGLPDIEFKPLDQKTEQPAASGASDSYDTYAADEGKSKAPVILTIVIILVLAIASYLIYNFVYKPSQEKARKEQLARQEAQRRQAEEARLAKEREAAEAERRRLEELANAKPAVGTIEILSGRTQRYYVVVTSDIDDDLLMDYAKKLSASGVSTKVIPPFGGKQFSRLAIADHETFALAQTNADASKATYGAGVWVLKY